MFLQLAVCRAYTTGSLWCYDIMVLLLMKYHTPQDVVHTVLQTATSQVSTLLLGYDPLALSSMKDV